MYIYIHNVYIYIIYPQLIFVQPFCIFLPKSWTASCQVRSEGEWNDGAFQPQGETGVVSFSASKKNQRMMTLLEEHIIDIYSSNI